MVQKGPERITQKDKGQANDLDYDEIKFPVDKEDFSKTETKEHLHCVLI